MIRICHICYDRKFHYYSCCGKICLDCMNQWYVFYNKTRPFHCPNCFKTIANFRQMLGNQTADINCVVKWFQYRKCPNCYSFIRRGEYVREDSVLCSFCGFYFSWNEESNFLQKYCFSFLLAFGVVWFCIMFIIVMMFI